MAGLYLVRDKSLAAKYRKMPCRACFSRAGVTGHHLLTVGAHPEYKNVPENIMPLCFHCHREVHDIGLTKFVNKNNLHNEMYTRGFDFGEYNQKWFIPKH